MKYYKVTDNRGRVTIPYEIRQRLKIGSNDILSFSLTDENAVVIRHEKICDNCRNISFEDKEYRNISIKKFIDDLSEEEQRDALVHLSVKWAANQGGEFNA